MTDRERQIEALMGQPIQLGWDGQIVRGTLSRLAAQRLIDHLNEAVPMVSAEVYALVLGECQKERQSAEAAARDFAKALRDTAGYGIGAWPHIERALARHPQFAEADENSDSMASTPRAASTERNQGGASRPHHTKGAE